MRLPGGGGFTLGGGGFTLGYTTLVPAEGGVKLPGGRGFYTGLHHTCTCRMGSETSWGEGGLHWGRGFYTGLHLTFLVCCSENEKCSKKVTLNYTFLHLSSQNLLFSYYFPIVHLQRQNRGKTYPL